MAFVNIFCAAVSIEHKMNKIRACRALVSTNNNNYCLFDAFASPHQHCNIRIMASCAFWLFLTHSFALIDALEYIGWWRNTTLNYAKLSWECIRLIVILHTCSFSLSLGPFWQYGPYLITGWLLLWFSSPPAIYIIRTESSMLWYRHVKFEPIAFEIVNASIMIF